MTIAQVRGTKLAIVGASGKNELLLHTDLLNVSSTWGWTELTEHPPDKRFKFGSLSWDIMLTKRPPVSSFSFGVDLSGMDILRVPPLTEEFSSGYSEILKRNIVVSETDVVDPISGKTLVKTFEHRVGGYIIHDLKAQHMRRWQVRPYKIEIDRIKLIDALGRMAYALLGFANGQFTVECDPNWLKVAAYPVRLDPTFGLTADPNDGFATFEDQMVGVNATAVDGNGTGTVISAFLEVTVAAKATKCALYLLSDSTLVANGVSDEVSVPVQAGTWTDFTLSGAPSIVDETAYVLVVLGTLTSGNGVVFRENTVGFTRYVQSRTYADGFPNPATFTTGANNQYGLHCDYTVGGGPAFVPKIMFFA